MKAPKKPQKFQLHHDRWVYPQWDGQRWFIGLRNGIGIGMPRTTAIELRKWLDIYIKWSAHVKPKKEGEGE